MANVIKGKKDAKTNLTAMEMAGLSENYSNMRLNHMMKGFSEPQVKVRKCNNAKRHKSRK